MYPWEIVAADGGLVCFVQSEPIARAIAAIPEREREIERLKSALIVANERWQERCARVAELEAALSDVLRNVMPYHQSWRIWDRIRTILTAKPTGEA